MVRCRGSPPPPTARIGQGSALSAFITTTVLPGGHAITAFPLASPPTGSTLHQDIYAVRGGLPILPGKTRKLR